MALGAAWRGLRRFFSLIVLVALVIMVTLNLHGMRFGGKHVHRVTYRITGTGPASIVYAEPLDDGKLLRVIRHVPLPWSRTVVMSGDVADYELIAKSNSRRVQAHIECVLAVDGNTAWTARLTAPLAKVRCYGTPYIGR